MSKNDSSIVTDFYQKLADFFMQNGVMSLEPYAPLLRIFYISDRDKTLDNVLRDVQNGFEGCLVYDTNISVSKDIVRKLKDDAQIPIVQVMSLDKTYPGVFALSIIHTTKVPYASALRVHLPDILEGTYNNILRDCHKGTHE